MGSLISTIMANLFMESFETRALSTSTNSASVWKRYVDDIFVVQNLTHKNEFLEHINSVDPCIQLTVEEAWHGSMLFLDTLVMPQSDGTLATTEYRKPTHTDQYLQWDSNHTISTKHSVVITLSHRQRLYVPTSNYCNKKKITCKKS